MKRYLLLILALTMTLSFSSCRRAAEKARRNIRIEAVEKFDRHGLSGVDITLRVKNNTGYKLVLNAAEMEVFFDGNRVGSVTLRERVEAPKRTTTSVETQWRLKIADPIALYLLVNKLQQGDIDQIAVSYSLQGRGGPAPVDILQEMVPLSQFLNNFGLSIEHLKNYMKE